MTDKLFRGANARIFQFSQELRKRQTDAETIMWGYLRNRKLGVKFRRQHPIQNYIADFYCHEVLLVIEIDGEIHNNAEHIEMDNNRDFTLAEFDITTIRFTNDEVEHQLEAVLNKINSYIKNYKLNTPSPSGEGWGEV